MPEKDRDNSFESLLSEGESKVDRQIYELQRELEYEKDARKEERFVFILIIIILLDIVFFSVQPSFGGPLALLILELIILIPLAKKMGMEQIAQIMSRTLERLVGKVGEGE